MNYKVVEVFADNGELSHIKVVNADTGETILDQSLELSMHDLLHRMATHKGDDLGLFAHEAAQLIKEIDNQ